MCAQDLSAYILFSELLLQLTVMPLGTDDIKLLQHLLSHVQLVARARAGDADSKRLNSGIHAQRQRGLRRV